MQVQCPAATRGDASIGSTVVIRDIDPGDESWLKRQARHVGVSMEEIVRGLIREKRIKTGHGAAPSGIFARHFGREHGVELPPPTRHSYKRIGFMDENDA